MLFRRIEIAMTHQDGKVTRLPDTKRAKIFEKWRTLVTATLCAPSTPLRFFIHIGIIKLVLGSVTTVSVLTT
jgi:hypothetical protein